MKPHNRQYKDSVFVDFFSEDKTAKENFLALYNALHATNYHSTTLLKNMRLERSSICHLQMTFGKKILK